MFDNIQHTTYNHGMKRTQVYIPDDLFAEAKAVAESSGKNISQILRMGLKMALEKEKVKKKHSLKSLIGTFGRSETKTGTTSSLAQNIDNIYELPWESDASRLTDQAITKIK